MAPRDLEDLVSAVRSRLRVARERCIFAVWADGTVSEESPDFLEHHYQNGRTKLPLALFASHKLVTNDEIRRKIEAGASGRRKGYVGTEISNELPRQAGPRT